MIYVYTTGDGKPYTAEDGTLLVVGVALDLITDRTAADVSRWRSLRDKGYINMTAAGATSDDGTYWDTSGGYSLRLSDGTDVTAIFKSLLA